MSDEKAIVLIRGGIRKTYHLWRYCGEKKSNEARGKVYEIDEATNGVSGVKLTEERSGIAFVARDVEDLEPGNVYITLPANDSYAQGAGLLQSVQKGFGIGSGICSPRFDSYVSQDIERVNSVYKKVVTLCDDLIAFATKQGYPDIAANYKELKTNLASTYSTGDTAIGVVSVYTRRSYEGELNRLVTTLEKEKWHLTHALSSGTAPSGLHKFHIEVLRSRTSFTSLHNSITRGASPKLYARMLSPGQMSNRSALISAYIKYAGAALELSKLGGLSNESSLARKLSYAKALEADPSNLNKVGLDYLREKLEQIEAELDSNWQKLLDPSFKATSSQDLTDLRGKANALRDYIKEIRRLDSYRAKFYRFFEQTPLADEEFNLLYYSPEFFTADVSETKKNYEKLIRSATVKTYLECAKKIKEEISGDAQVLSLYEQKFASVVSTAEPLTGSAASASLASFKGSLSDFLSYFDKELGALDSFRAANSPNAKIPILPKPSVIVGDYWAALKRLGSDGFDFVATRQGAYDPEYKLTVQADQVFDRPAVSDPSIKDSITSILVDLAIIFKNHPEAKIRIISEDSSKWSFDDVRNTARKEVLSAQIKLLYQYFLKTVPSDKLKTVISPATSAEEQPRKIHFVIVY